MPAATREVGIRYRIGWCIQPSLQLRLCVGCENVGVATLPVPLTRVFGFSSVRLSRMPMDSRSSAPLGGGEFHPAGVFTRPGCAATGTLTLAGLSSWADVRICRAFGARGASFPCRWPDGLSAIGSGCRPLVSSAVRSSRVACPHGWERLGAALGFLVVAHLVGVNVPLLLPFSPFVLSVAPAVAAGVPLSRFAPSPVWGNGAALFAYGAVLGGVCSLILAGGADPIACGAFSLGV